MPQGCPRLIGANGFNFEEIPAWAAATGQIRLTVDAAGLATSARPEPSRDAEQAQRRQTQVIQALATQEALLEHGDLRCVHLPSVGP